MTFEANYHLIIGALTMLQQEVYAVNAANGWWDEPRSFAAFVALAHSELSEALEAARNGNPPDKHLPEYDGVTVELADCIIRILDYAGKHELPLALALLAKLEFNRGRGYKHGGKEF